MFAFNARSGTVPLPLGRFWGQATWGIFRDRLLLLVRDRLRRAGGALGTGRWEALGQKIGDRLPRERYRGSLGLGGFWGLAPRDRACARRKALGRGVAIALCARGWGVRLQCSLRHCPAAAGYLLGTGCSCWLGTGYWGALSSLRGQAAGAYNSWWRTFGGGLGTGCSRPVLLRLGSGMGLLATAWSG